MEEVVEIREEVPAYLADLDGQIGAIDEEIRRLAGLEAKRRSERARYAAAVEATADSDPATIAKAAPLLAAVGAVLAAIANEQASQEGARGELMKKRTAFINGERTRKERLAQVTTNIAMLKIALSNQYMPRAERDRAGLELHRLEAQLAAFGGQEEQVTDEQE